MKILMTTLLTILMTTLLTISVYANTIFYDPVTKEHITDVSDSKSLNQIKKEFNLSDSTQMVVLGKDEAARVENNNLVKYDYVKENKAIKAAKEAAKEAAKKVKADAIQAKLGLTNQEWKDLKDALK